MDSVVIVSFTLEEKSYKLPNNQRRKRKGLYYALQRRVAATRARTCTNNVDFATNNNVRPTKKVKRRRIE